MSARVAFFGTPEVAVPSLQALIDAEDLDVVAAVTNPDRPRGRSRRPVAPPVKEAAAAAGVDVLQPARPVEILDRLHDLDLEVAAVVAYGALLPKAVLDAPTHGFVNLHFSLLPRWRGAAPVQHAVRAGDRVTGVTTFVLDEGMDTGPVLEQARTPIGPRDTAGDLLERLSVSGADVLVSSLRRLLAGERPEPQPPEGATLAPKLRPEDAAVDWTASAAEVDRLVRAVNPAPGAHTTWRDERFKIWAATPHVEPADAAPGTIVRADADALVIAAGDVGVRLVEVQPAGKARMDAAAFVNGYHPRVGEALGG